MNFYEKTVGTPYLKWTQILPVLEQFKTEGYFVFENIFSLVLSMRLIFMSDIVILLSCPFLY